MGIGSKVWNIMSGWSDEDIVEAQAFIDARAGGVERVRTPDVELRPKWGENWAKPADTVEEIPAAPAEPSAPAEPAAPAEGDEPQD